MKLLFILLLAAVATTLCSGEYINYVPVPVDSDGYCQNDFGSGEGLGYSILIGQCFTLDGLYSHMFTGSSENDTLTHNQYNADSNGLAQCSGTPLTSDLVVIGNCLFYNEFNTYFSDMDNAFNVNVSVSEFSSLDQLSSGTYLNSYTSNGCTSSNEPYLLEYIVGGLSTTVGNKDVSFICTNNVPFKQSCDVPPILKFNDVNNLQSCRLINESANCKQVPKTNNYLSTSCVSN